MNLGQLIDQLSDALYFNGDVLDRRARDSYREYSQLFSCTEDKILDDPQNPLNAEFNNVFSGDKIVVSRALFERMRNLIVTLSEGEGEGDMVEALVYEARGICRNQDWERDDDEEEDDEDEDDDGEDY